MAGGEGMGKRVAQDKVPPGWRFNPQDPELVNYYLKGKVCNKPIDADAIPEVDLYKFEPWDLSDKCPFKSNDGDMYFFSPRDKKYPNGLRTNRATLAGYWKATGKDRPVKGQVKKGRSGVVGMKKTLVFYRGRAPHGERTDFVMHEYRLVEEQYEKINIEKDFVICRVFKKNGVGPRNSEDRGLESYFDDDDDSSTEERQVSSPTSTLESNHTQNEPAETTEVEQPVDAQQSAESSESAQPGMSIVDYENSNFLVQYPLSLAECLANTQVDVYHDSNESNQWNPDFVLQDAYEIPSGLQLDALEAPAPDPAPGPDSWLEFFNGDFNNMNPIGSNTSVSSADGTCYAPGGNLSWNVEHLAESLLDDEDNLPPLVEEREVHSPSEFMDNQPPQQRMAYFGQTSEVATVEQTEQTMGNMAWAPAPGPVAEQGLVYDPSIPAADPLNHTYVAVPAAGYAEGLESLADSSDFLQDCFEDPLQYPAEFDQGFTFPTLEDTSGSYSRNQNVSRTEIPSSISSTNFGASTNIGAHGQSQNVSFDQNAAMDAGIMSSKPLVASILKYLGAIPTLPASAAECPPELKSSMALQTTSHLGDMAPSYNSIHVSAAVTVTCTRSADGKQQVQTAVTDCYEDSEGLYQQVVSKSWQSIPGEKGPKQGQTHTMVNTGAQRRVARGSNSGFVFVFILGVMSAVIWALAFRGVYKVVRHIVMSLF